MHLLQFSQSIDSPSEIYVAFQRDPLLWPSLPPPQEGHGDTRVPGQMPSDPLRCTSTSKKPHPSPPWDNQPYTSLKYHTPNLNHQHRPLSCFAVFSLFFYSINNSKCKSPEQMLREKKMGEELGTMKRGKTERKEEKKHKWRTKQPSWSTFATGSQ